MSSMMNSQFPMDQTVPTQTDAASPAASQSPAAANDSTTPTGDVEPAKDKVVIANGDSIATRLVKLAKKAEVEVWHDRKMQAWATFQQGDHLEHWPVESQMFRRYLMRLFHKEEGRAPRGAELRSALTDLEAEAWFDGPEHETYVRIAEPRTGTIFLDLANEAWQAVEITATGSRVLSAKDVPVKFRRLAGMRPLPVPEAGGSLDNLAGALCLDVAGNLWRTLRIWLVAMLRGTLGGYPVLVLNGEHGSGKTTVAKLLRAVVDPNDCASRALPSNTKDLFIAAANSWIQEYDNLSGIPTRLSDDLCRLATGGGLATRKLYTDTGETLLVAKRPILLNGIGDFVTRQDLVDRSLLVTLPTIDEDKRQPEAKLLERFKEAWPGILGALCGVIAAGLARLPEVQLDRLPRLADFALWIAACAPALGEEPDELLMLLDEVRAEMIHAALEGDPVAEAIINHMETHTEVTHTAGELQDKLPGEKKPQDWPKTAKGMSNHLARLAPALYKRGIIVERRPREHGGRRPWRIAKREISK